MARSSKLQDQARVAPRLRRAYYECRYGQLHLHNAIPGGGGFDELTPVVCLHGAGETGRVFAPVLSVLGEARSVYAFDLPGTGESDPAPGEAAVDSTISAVVDFIDSMRIRQFDLLARGDAAAAVLKLFEARGPAIRRAVLLGAAGVRSAPKITLLSAADAASPQLPARLVDLLGAGA
ncbi:MAG: alpha/beta fold hydrolase [Pseudomonadota bacterium]